MAVYTRINKTTLEDFLGSYAIGDLLDYKGIAEGVENTNYLLQTTKGNFILTLYEKRVNLDDLPFFLDLMGFLSQKGLPCPAPIADKHHRVLQTLCGRPAAITSFLPGVWPRRIHSFHCLAVGEALARLHEAAWDFPGHRKNDLSLEGWGDLFANCEAQAHPLAGGLGDEIEREIHFLEKNWPEGLPAGIIHADLFPDNVFFQEEKITGIIDFYFACTDFFTYDLAICLNAWCFEDNLVFNEKKAMDLLASYQKYRPLSGAEKDALPLLARGSALRFLLTRLYDWQNHVSGAFVTPKDPNEYLQRLRFFQTSSLDFLKASMATTSDER